MTLHERHNHSMVSLQTLLTLAVTVMATVSLAAIDARRDPLTQRGQPSINNNNKNNNNNNMAQKPRVRINYKVTHLNASASAVMELPEATTSISGLHSAIVRSTSRQAFQTMTSSQSTRGKNERGKTKLIQLAQQTSHNGLPPLTTLSEGEATSDDESKSLSEKSSSRSRRKQRRRHNAKRRRRRRRRKNRRQSRRKSNKNNKKHSSSSGLSTSSRGAKRRKKLKGISKLAFERLNANEEASSSFSTSGGAGNGKDSSRRRKGRKNSKNKKIVIAEQVSFPSLKERCKTQPMQQEIRVEGCKSKIVMNNFCYGQCISVYIPEARGTGSGDPSFVSCGFCRPREIKHISVPLRCRTRNGRIRWERRRVPYVKECRCMDQKVQI